MLPFLTLKVSRSVSQHNNNSLLQGSFICGCFFLLRMASQTYTRDWKWWESGSNKSRWLPGDQGTSSSKSSPWLCQGRVWQPEPVPECQPGSGSKGQQGQIQPQEPPWELEWAKARLGKQCVGGPMARQGRTVGSWRPAQLGCYSARSCHPRELQYGAGLWSRWEEDWDVGREKRDYQCLSAMMEGKHIFYVIWWNNEKQTHSNTEKPPKKAVVEDGIDAVMQFDRHLSWAFIRLFGWRHLTSLLFCLQQSPSYILDVSLSRVLLPRFCFQIWIRRKTKVKENFKNPW